MHVIKYFILKKYNYFHNKDYEKKYYLSKKSLRNVIFYHKN